MNNIKIKNLIIKNKNKIKKSRILCIGDIILDQYIYGRVERISPEAPIPILLVENETYALGGVGNVARNISSIGGKVVLITLSGNDQESAKISELVNEFKHIKKLKLKIKNFKTPLKTRYINNSAHMIRVDKEMPQFKLSKTQNEKILDLINKEIMKCDLILLSDYNKGLFSKELIKKIVKLAKVHNKIVLADPKSNDFSIYSGVNILTPNHKEITQSSTKKNLNEKNLVSYGQEVIKKYNIEQLLVTRSEKGMMLIKAESSKNFREVTKKVYDVTGAGDTVIAILSLMKAIGLDTEHSSMIANYIAGIVVGKPGTAAANYSDFID